MVLQKVWGLRLWDVFSLRPGSCVPSGRRPRGGVALLCVSSGGLPACGCLGCRGPCRRSKVVCWGLRCSHCSPFGIAHYSGEILSSYACILFLHELSPP